MRDGDLFKSRIFPLTQKEAGQWLGVSPVSITRWVKGVHPIKRIVWLAVSRKNLVDYINKNPEIKQRVFDLAGSDEAAMQLFKELVK